MKRRRQLTAGVVYDLVATVPGLSLAAIRTELGASAEAVDRITRRMRAAGQLVISIGDDEKAGTYAINPNVAFVDSVKKIVKKRKPLTDEQREKYAKARRAREAQRRASGKAEGRCTKCRAGLPDNWPRLLCPECTERQRAYNKAYAETERGRLAHQRSGQSFRERHAQERATYMRKLWQQRKLAGQCPRCSRPAMDGSNFCEWHQAYMREKQRVSIGRKRDSQRRSA